MWPIDSVTAQFHGVLAHPGPRVGGEAVGPLRRHVGRVAPLSAPRGISCTRADAKVFSGQPELNHDTQVTTTALHFSSVNMIKSINRFNISLSSPCIKSILANKSDQARLLKDPY